MEQRRTTKAKKGCMLSILLATQSQGVSIEPFLHRSSVYQNPIFYHNNNKSFDNNDEIPNLNEYYRNKKFLGFGLLNDFKGEYKQNNEGQYSDNSRISLEDEFNENLNDYDKENYLKNYLLNLVKFPSDNEVVRPNVNENFDTNRNDKYNPAGLPDVDVSQFNTFEGYLRKPDEGDNFDQRSVDDMEGSFDRKKKSRGKKCKVVVHMNNHDNVEEGYEFFPAFYKSSSCLPLTQIEEIEARSGRRHTQEGHQICHVYSDSCTTVTSTWYFLKKKKGNKCYPLDSLSRQDIGAGCNCIEH